MTESKPPLNKIRRANLSKDDTWIQNFMHRGEMGTLATCVDGQPFLVTRNYVYEPDNHVIYLHGAKKGRTYHNIQENDRICFIVSEMGRLLPANDALEVGVEFAGVVVFGRINIVRKESEAQRGLQLLLDKYFPHLLSGEDYDPISPEAIDITAVLRIDIECWSGKEKTADPDFPGAYFFKDILNNPGLLQGNGKA
jgi:nitroimidazol reductase NimA-like FMN-containing flavoprotein (pyridoxamine 5'-phosphate oxidase superfamily)